VRRFGSGAILFVAALSLSTVACRSADDVAKDALRARLRQEVRLTTPEIQQLFEAVAPVIAEKTIRVREGAVTHELTAEQRSRVLEVLTDATAVYDAGVRAEAGSTWRGITGGATPPTSEIDALQTLWIDVTSFVPRRYEFAYSTPGLGDVTYDLTFE
jgi:hypothetical protein